MIYRFILSYCADRDIDIDVLKNAFVLAPISPTSG